MERGSIPGRLPSRDTLVLRNFHDNSPIKIPQAIAKKTDSHGKEFTSPEGGGVVLGLHKAEILSRDWSTIDMICKPVDSSSRDGISKVNSPPDGVTTSMTRQ